VRWAGYAAGTGEMRNAYRILVGKPERRVQLEDLDTEDQRVENLTGFICSNGGRGGLAKTVIYLLGSILRGGFLTYYFLKDYNALSYLQDGQRP
jgi:hypothetical protein